MRGGAAGKGKCPDPKLDLPLAPACCSVAVSLTPAVVSRCLQGTRFATPLSMVRRKREEEKEAEQEAEQKKEEEEAEGDGGGGGGGGLMAREEIADALLSSLSLITAERACCVSSFEDSPVCTPGLKPWTGHTLCSSLPAVAAPCLAHPSALTAPPFEPSCGKLMCAFSKACFAQVLMDSGLLVLE